MATRRSSRVRDDTHLAPKPTSKPASRAATSKRASAKIAAPPSTNRKRTRTETEESENTAPPDSIAAKPSTRKPRSAAPTIKKSKPPKSKSKSASKPASAPAKTAERASAKKQRLHALPTVDEAKDDAEAPAKPPTKKKDFIEPKEPYFNPLPRIPKHLRPTPLMFVWGAGNFGQFGMGTTFSGELDKPTRNKLIEEKIQEGGVFGEQGAGIEYVASGGLHTLFVDEKGAVWSCGVNDGAALGRVTKVIKGDSGTLNDDDNLVMAPHPIQSLIDENFRAVKVVAGDSISAALSDQGDLHVWGSFRADEGQLGYSSSSKLQFRPVPVLNFPTHRSRDVEKVSAIASGHNHLLALTTHGAVYTWGAGEHGQLGRRLFLRHKLSGLVPERVFLGGSGGATKTHRQRRAVAIGAGGMTSFAVDEDGVLWAWGLNNLGQTGTGSTETDVAVPTPVVGLSAADLSTDRKAARVVAMEGGEHHALFLTSDGRVYACGRANAGQVGVPRDDPVFVARGEDRDHLRVPVRVRFPDDEDGDDPIVMISCGLHNNAAISKRGAMYCWGQGTQGELGLKDEEEVWTPTVVVRREGGKWKAVHVSCGGQHTVGLFMSKAD